MSALRARREDSQAESDLDVSNNQVRCRLTLDGDGSCVTACLHQAAQEDGDILDVALLERRGVL